MVKVPAVPFGAVGDHQNICEAVSPITCPESLMPSASLKPGAVESAHKQVVHARLRQAGMRWSDAGARRLLALRLQLLNDNWALLDRLRMVSLA